MMRIRTGNHTGALAKTGKHPERAVLADAPPASWDGRARLLTRAGGFHPPSTC